MTPVGETKLTSLIRARRPGSHKMPYSQWSWPGDGSRKGEESPDFAEHGALGNGGRGDPTESATETNRLSVR